MNKKHLIAGLFLTFVIIILGCAQKEQKLTEKSKTINAEEQQQTSISKNNSTSENQQILNEMDNTEALDSALGELDSIE